MWWAAIVAVFAAFLSMAIPMTLDYLADRKKRGRTNLVTIKTMIIISYLLIAIIMLLSFVFTRFI